MGLTSESAEDAMEDAGGKLYPSDDYVRIMENLAHLHVGNVHPEQVLVCLRAVHNIAASAAAGER